MTDTYVRENPIPAKALVLTVHDPIFIDGNAGFTNASGVVWGSGTALDPFIIAGWDIDAFIGGNLSNTYGIRIESTEAYFIVRNCWVYNGSSFYGIYLSNCVNGIVEDNSCWNDYSGIAISSSNLITLRNNTCSNDFTGITLISSSNNTLSNNDCGPSGQICLLLAYSSGNTLVNNTCSYGYEGIRLDLSSNNTLIGNNCSSNYFGGIDFTSSSNNEISQNLVYDNTVYGAYIESGSNNHIWNNTFIDNNGATSTYNGSHVQALDDGTNNWWNSTDGYGNYWSDWTTPDVTPPYGIVDLPYNVSGSAGAKDYYPLTIEPAGPIPEFGIVPLVAMVMLGAVLLTIVARRKKVQ